MAEDFSSEADALSFIKGSLSSDYLVKGAGDFVVIPQLQMGAHIDRVRGAFECLGIEAKNIELLPDESGKTNFGGYKISGKDSLAVLAKNNFNFTRSGDYLQTLGKA